ncbi:uncharacterized protein B0H18DRAFT_986285 [Fomitopsis serialis]|uniref:uncharacterized protein n=1 Tax=Fomitopsis serialis TaxID=139415 RepID=UPI0020086561|nr:uncharacterized protein B0H18DRAFT_986285 [Neoantrodia serialis]KAH9932569.1 hypothetical protein B0H18DRAFT_986285 [Neoantrodia serialis]
MRFSDLDDYSLSASELSLASRRIHPLAKRQALSTIDIKWAEQVKRICRYLLADVPNRLHFVRALTVSRHAFNARFGDIEAGNFSTVHFLADVLERAPNLKSLRLEAAGRLFEAQPRVAAAICRMSWLLDVELRDLTSASFEVVGRLSCMPRRLSLHGFDTGSELACHDGTPLLSAPVLRSVRSLQLVKLRIANQLVHSADSSNSSLPTKQWPEVTELKVERSNVSVATLIRAFPAVKTIQFQDIEDWVQRNTPGSASWVSLDHAYGTSLDFSQWEMAGKVRWLMVDWVCNSTNARRTLPTIQRTSPVILSLRRLPVVLDTDFWPEFIRSAPNVRYLDLTLSSSESMAEVRRNWTGETLSALSRLPLVALHLCRRRWDNVIAQGIGEDQVIGSGLQFFRWRSAAYNLAVDIADKITSLSVISVGEGVQVTDEGIPGTRLCGPALWWRVVASDELSSITLKGEREEHMRQNEDSRSCDEEDSASNEEIDGPEDEESDGKDQIPELGSESSSTQDEDESEYNLTSAEMLGTNASRRLVPISRDLGEHIHAYLVSSEFTETSAFDDELFERLSRTVVPRGVRSEP